MRMMQNNQGSILVMTLAFVLAFTMLGVGSTHFAFVQNEVAEKEKGSMEAFWLADGAMEMARYKLTLSDLISPDKDCIFDDTHTDYPYCGDPDSYSAAGRGFYHVYSEPVIVGSTDNWLINSHAFVSLTNLDGSDNDPFRGIIAKYGSYDIENAITTHGTVNGGCGPAGSATITGTCAPNVSFIFETIFNGMSQADFEAIATAAGQNYNLSSNSDLWGIFGITVIHTLNPFHNPTFNTDNSAEYDGQPAFLIVDTSGYTGNPIPTLTINGTAAFCGIIWTIGEVKIAGTSEVQGTIFIDGDPVEDTPFTGNADLAFDLPCINGAISQLGGTGPPSFYAWNEYTQ